MPEQLELDNEEALDEQVTAENESDDKEVEAEEESTQDEEDAGEDSGGESEEVTVSLEEEEERPQWARDLRQRHKDLSRENRELKEKLESVKNPVVSKLRPKPRLEDFDYDTDAYEKDLDAWVSEKVKIDAEESRIKQEKEEKEEQLRRQQQVEAQAWKVKLDSYADGKQSLVEKDGAKDYEDAEDTASAILNRTQQGIIVGYAVNPALVIYALGKNPNKAKELSEEQDPIAFALKVQNFEEKKMKVTRKKAPPPPGKVTDAGSASVGDSALDKLRKEAEKTRDYSKVVAYKRKKRKA